MYKIMLVDDEGIVLDSLRYIIEKNFRDSCQVESAKTGRAAIELSEGFHPDIVFMDIQMPGINGIEAMKEIKNRNNSIVFIVLSAFDRFNYAKEAIDLGVLEYMMKPFNSNKIIEVVKKAIAQIEKERQKISNHLEMREKLKTVVPILENSFVYTVMFQELSASEAENYKNLLGIQGSKGYAMVMEYGDEQKNGTLTNPVGVSVRIQKVYQQIREIVKEFFPAYIGSPMANRITLYVPYEGEEMEYNERIRIIENARVMIRKMAKMFEMQFKIGIGSPQEIREISKSYREAIEAVKNPKSKVTHIRDIIFDGKYETYPIEMEKQLFRAIEKGKIGMARNFANRFFDWMIKESMQDGDSIRLKVLEFTLFAEHIVYENTDEVYHFSGRKNYLREISEMSDYNHLRVWFLDKITETTTRINKKEETQASSLVERACDYIQEHFSKDISLDGVSKEINISPYYFSKLFKEEKKENFVEYVTRVRIDYAKKMLKNSENSIKEICVSSGYGDPNYFSRIFKKMTGVTPSEYREGGEGQHER